jgi:small conductance mechanosensitive channel
MTNVNDVADLTFLDDLKHGALIKPDRLLGAVFWAVVFAVLAWLIGRALRLAVQRVLARDTRSYVDRTSINFLAQVAQIGVWFVAFIHYASLVPALSHLGTAWLTAASVLSVIMGLAAQSTLGNLIAGFSLVLYRPFKLGDRLQVNAPTGLENGVVESLGLGYTVLKTDDNRRIVVPNSVIASQTTVNLTGDDPRALCSVPIGISYDAGIDKAREILLELLHQHPQAKEVCGCPVTQLGVNGVVLTPTAWCAGTDAAVALKCDLLEQARKRFAAAGIEMPLPQTVVTLKSPATAPPMSQVDRPTQ